MVQAPRSHRGALVQSAGSDFFRNLAHQPSPLSFGTQGPAGPLGSKRQVKIFSSPWSPTKSAMAQAPRSHQGALVQSAGLDFFRNLGHQPSPLSLVAQVQVSASKKCEPRSPTQSAIHQTPKPHHATTQLNPIFLPPLACRRPPPGPIYALIHYCPTLEAPDITA